MSKVIYYPKRFSSKKNNFTISNNNYVYAYKKKYFRNNNSYNINYNEERKKNSFDYINSLNFGKQYNSEYQKELLRINLYINNGKYRNLILYENEDIINTVNNFCIKNNISKKLVEPLTNKIQNSLNTINSIKSIELGRNNISILEKMKKQNQYDNKY